MQSERSTRVFYLDHCISRSVAVIIHPSCLVETGKGRYRNEHNFADEDRRPSAHVSSGIARISYAFFAQES